MALSTVNNYYLKYWMLNEGFQQFLHSLSTGSTATGIKSSKLFLLPLVRPNIEQQNKIVEYLDAKCSKIDEIVEKQKVIIEKLEEYKLSIITEAVTSGINPDVEMKDSGSVWFGNIPINWEMKRLKYVFHIQKDIAGEEGHTVLSITQRGIIPKDKLDNFSWSVMLSCIFIMRLRESSYNFFKNISHFKVRDFIRMKISSVCCIFL